MFFFSKKFRSTVIIVTFFLIFLSFYKDVQSQGIGHISQHDLSNKETMYFGVLPDADPISNVGSTSFSGYCNDLKEYLDNKIYPENKIVLASIDYQNRFIGKGTVSGDTVVDIDIECGSNTIKKDRIESLLKTDDKNYVGEFSTFFFQTGAKILLKKGDKNINLKKYYNNDLFNDSNNESINLIAVIGKINSESPSIGLDTTTNSLIQGIYPNAIVEPFADRKSALEAFKNRNDIVAYVSDEILLNAMLKDERVISEPNKYIIVPKNGYLSYEDYGIVVYKTGKFQDLLDYINRWIKDHDSKAEKKLNSYTNQNILSKQILKWHQGNIKTFWFILFSIALIPILLVNYIFPFVKNIFVKAVPDKFALWLFEISKGRLILVISDTYKNSIKEDKVLKADISALPSSSDTQTQIKQSFLEIYQRILNEPLLDNESKQRAVEEMRNLTSEYKKKIQTNLLQSISDRLQSILNPLETSVSGVTSFFEQIVELKGYLENLDE